MSTLVRPGVPVGGFKTVGQIRATNQLVFRRDQNAMGIAVELLTTHTPGAPVVDERGEFVDERGSRVASREKAGRAALAEKTEAGLIAFLALIEHARAHGREPVKLFVRSLQAQRWHFITQADEDAAMAKLKRYRNPEPRSAEASKRAPAPRMTRERWLKMDRIEQLLWKLDERRRAADERDWKMHAQRSVS